MTNKDSNLIIDNHPIKFKEGQTILEILRDAEIYIPTLCNFEGLTPSGSCRLCIVKIEGIKGYPPACTTPAQKDMKIITMDDELQELRREVLKLILSEHPYICLICDDKEYCENMRHSIEKSGKMFGCFSCSSKNNCELRELFDYLDIKDIKYELEYKNYPLKRDDPFLAIDYNLCVLCGRCVRICNELRGVGAINYINRGHDTRISTAFDLLHLDTNCQFCGACVDVCPTGALTSKNSKWFDKFSKVTTSICGFCGVGCEFDYFSYNGKLVESIPNKENLENIKKSCLFGRFCTVPFNNGKERLKIPLIKNANSLIPCKWDEAYNIIKENLNRYKPEEIAILFSPDLSNESAYVLNKFSYNVIKTGNIALVSTFNDTINSMHLLRKANSEGVLQIISNENQKPLQNIVNSIKEGEIKALYLTERIDNPELLENIEFLILQDIYPSDDFQYANVILPTTTFIESSGSLIDYERGLQKFESSAIPEGVAKPDWQIFCELAKMYENKNNKEFGFSNSNEIFELIKKEFSLFRDDNSGVSMKLDNSQTKFTKFFEENPSHFIVDPLMLDSFKYRGEKISNQVANLKVLIEYRDLRKSGKISESKKEKLFKTRFKVISNSEIALNIYKMVIKAPLIAKKAKAGNFIIVMKDETSERIPLTISDWNVPEGTITVYIIDRGFSTADLIGLNEDDYIYSVVGPLGNSAEIKNYGTVLLAGGCYGIGAIYPIAKALKAYGNKVLIALESRNKLQIYLEKSFEKIVDKVIYITADGSKGLKGRINTIESVINDNKPIHQCFFIGCKLMMMKASETTKNLGNIPTFVSLNTIMIDGTGMCGSCRIGILHEGKMETKFTCIDGPIFDGHQVDWEELTSRSERFNESESKIYQNHSCKAVNRFFSGEIDE